MDKMRLPMPGLCLLVISAHSLPALQFRFIKCRRPVCGEATRRTAPQPEINLGETQPIPIASCTSRQTRDCRLKMWLMLCFWMLGKQNSVLVWTDFTHLSSN